MRVKQKFTGEEFDVVELIDLEAKETLAANPDAPEEHLVEVMAPSGEILEVSVAAGTRFLVAPTGERHVFSPSSVVDFEEIQSNG